MTTATAAALRRQEPGMLPATLVIVLADSALLPQHVTEVTGRIPMPDWRDEEPTWEDAEWR